MSEISKIKVGNTTYDVKGKASDVYDWAKLTSKPTYDWSEISDIQYYVDCYRFEKATPYNGSLTLYLNRNKHVFIGEVVTLTINLPVIDEGNNFYDYKNNISKTRITNFSFEFDSGSTATTLSIPSSVDFGDEDLSSLDTNTHYEVHIRYNPLDGTFYGLIHKWAKSS